MVSFKHISFSCRIISLSETIHMKGTSKAEEQRIKMQKLLRRQKVANDVTLHEKEISELRIELKRLTKKTFPQFG